MSNDRYENIRKVLAECRDIAMEWTMRGRIPECGKFGEIAQDLDVVCAELENSTRWNPITDAERDKLAAEIEALRVEVAAQRTRADAMTGEAIRHEARAERLAEALRYAVDNPDFDSERFDALARTALAQEADRE